jgi:hypothetical protein
MIEERKDDPEPLTLSKNEIKSLLSTSGVNDEKLEDFDTHFVHAAAPFIPESKPVSADAAVPSKNPAVSLYAGNISAGRSFEVKTPDVVIKLNPDRTDLIETREIDGRNCLVIEITDSIEVNGIPVKK